MVITLNCDYELSPYFQKLTLAFYFIVKLVSVQCIAYELQWIDITGSNQEQISLTFFIRKQTTVIKSLAKKMIALNFFYYYIYVYPIFPFRQQNGISISVFDRFIFFWGECRYSQEEDDSSGSGCIPLAYRAVTQKGKKELQLYII